MILQALAALYGELCRQGKVAAEGWSPAKVTHRIDIDEEGRLLGILSLRDRVTRGKKEVDVPKVVLVPEQVKRSSGIKPNFLCDGPGYFFGIDEAKPKRAAACFEAAKQLHHAVLDGCSSPAAAAVLRFFDTWKPEEAADHPVIVRHREELQDGGNCLFWVNDADVLADEAVRGAWDAWQEEGGADDSPVGTCLVTGRTNQKIALLHPPIKGVPGAQSSGASLVSFNGDAFCSYGHDGEQGENAPVSKPAAFAYGTALNFLLADREHTTRMGDTTVVYWSEHAENITQDIFAQLMGDSGKISDEALHAVMEAMAQGQPADMQGVRIDPEEPFYILGLAPNAARLSVRFFLRNTFGRVMRNLAAHQDRMRMDCRPPWEKAIIPLWRTLRATANPNSRDNAASPLLAGSLMRAVFSDSPYPEAVYQNILLRIFADHDAEADGIRGHSEKIGYVRAALIKAYLLKNRNQRWEGSIRMIVNEECREISYVLGRLFSVLENLQMQANPGINATIKDRYFNSACATPASVFPVLLKLANAHLDKVKNDEKISIYFRKKIGSLMAKIAMPDKGTPLPKRLSLEEQGAFVLGYYQETQDRYAGKKEEH